MLITISSYKGGTGKTMFAINLAMILTTNGKKVCLIDLDLQAPSIYNTFKNRKKFWINDYLNKVCKIDQVLNDYTPAHLNKGNLFVGMANPNLEAIREISSKDRKWEMNALGRILNLNSILHKEDIDHVIIDSSPGLQYSSINACIAADLVLMITSLEASDQQGTQSMLSDLHDIYEKKTGIIVNKVSPAIFSGQKSLKISDKLPLISLVPCSCDILRSQGDYLYTRTRLNNPITKCFKKIAMEIEKIEESIGWGMQQSILGH